MRQSERGGPVRRRSGEGARLGRRRRDADGAVRLGSTTLLRADRTATYQLASVIDDLDLRITTSSAARTTAEPEVQHGSPARRRRAPGGDPPRARARPPRRSSPSATATRRSRSSATRGCPRPRCAYLDELDLPEHDVQLDLCGCGGSRSTRSRRCRTRTRRTPRVLRSTRCPPCAAPARSSRRARTHASYSSRPPELPVTATDARALRRAPRAAPDRLSRDDARAILRELKAVGGDLRTLRLALTGAETGPELASVLAAIPRRGARPRVARVPA